MLADAAPLVMVFETGLPPRYYFDRSAVDLSLASSYDFPTRQLLPIAGMIACYDEQVDVVLDGEPQPRPTPILRLTRDARGPQARYSGLGLSGRERSQSRVSLPCAGTPPASLSIRAKCSRFQAMKTVLRVVHALRWPPSSPSR